MHSLRHSVTFLLLLFITNLGCLPASAETAVILNSGDGSISLVDTVTYKETTRFPVGKEPHHLMATPDDKELIVANAAGNDLVFISPHSGEILRRLPRISDPYQIGYSPDKKWFASASNRLDRVDIYHAAVTARWCFSRSRKATKSPPSVSRRLRCCGNTRSDTSRLASG
jgi:YVTN family beta-propeller protein